MRGTEEQALHFARSGPGRFPPMQEQPFLPSQYVSLYLGINRRFEHGG